MGNNKLPYDQGWLLTKDDGTIYGKRKLMPCPFCGDVKSLKIYFNKYKADDGTKTTAASVYCKCGCALRVFVGRTKSEAINEAIKAWNTRK